MEVDCSCYCWTCGTFASPFLLCNFSKEFQKGLVDKKGEVLSLILSVVAKGRGGHGSRGGFLCKLGPWGEKKEKVNFTVNDSHWCIADIF